MRFSAGMYIINHDVVKGFFTEFGYPTYINLSIDYCKITWALCHMESKF